MTELILIAISFFTERENSPKCYIEPQKLLDNQNNPEQKEQYCRDYPSRPQLYHRATVTKRKRKQKQKTVLAQKQTCSTVGKRPKRKYMSLQPSNMQQRFQECTLEPGGGAARL